MQLQFHAGYIVGIVSDSFALGSDIASENYNHLFFYDHVCQQKPITTFLRELQLFDEDNMFLKMIPGSVLCQNYVDLRVELRRYIELWSAEQQVSVCILGA